MRIGLQGGARQGDKVIDRVGPVLISVGLFSRKLVLYATCTLKSMSVQGPGKADYIIQ